MKYKSILAVLVVAALAVSVIPMVSDGSDAASLTDGNSGVGYSVTNLSGDNLAKLMPAAVQEQYAEDLLDDILENTADFAISGLDVTEYKAAEYKGTSIKGYEVTDVKSTEKSFKITFTATNTATTPDTLFTNAEKNTDLIKQVGIANLSQKDATFTVTAYMKINSSEKVVSTFAANEANNLVLVKSWTRDYNLSQKDADVTYKFKEDAADRTVPFKLETGSESSVTEEINYTFDDVKKTTDMTTGYKKVDISGYGYHMWDKVTYDGDTKGTDMHIFDPEFMHIFSPESAYAYATVVTEDLTAPAYHLYGTDGNSIFTPFSTIDPSLWDNTALTDFIKATEGGTVSDTYDAASSSTDSNYNDVSLEDDMVKILIIGIVVIAVFALIFIILLVVLIIVVAKRKKR